ncbi:protein UL91 [macacine betaherpesvirus 9]|uniref:Protein UL91 n=1 Tax=macacine betaherpesvirus 9 TaxID=2560568 RepID=A0A191S3W6_9BETA|nr:protein UL91 [macacine betaherpesvirus 9]ANC96594.1 protein UL91 [macacine betaherpesvirus 9]
MNNVLHDIKREFSCSSKEELLNLINSICLNCSFIIEPVESLPRKTDLVAVLYDSLAIEIFTDLLKNEYKDRK